MQRQQHIRVNANIVVVVVLAVRVELPDRDDAARLRLALRRVLVLASVRSLVLRLLLCCSRANVSVNAIFVLCISVYACE